MPQVFKIGPYWVYFWANESDMAIIEARSEEVITKWENFFGEAHYYC